MPAFFDKMLRAGEGRILRKLSAISTQVNAIEDEFAAMTDAELMAMTDEFRKRLAGEDGKAETLDDLLPARQPSARWASGTSTYRSWAVQPFISATSPR